MTRHPPHPSRNSNSRAGPGSAALRVLVAAVVAAGLAGCRATPAYQGGERTVLAKYQFRRLTADLPQTVRVPGAMAAATEALIARGYAVQPDTTHGSGRVVATAPASGLLDKVTVMASEVPGAVRVEIVVDPLGDQTESRAILDAMLVRLGL
jgi:hypothetical protein